LVVQLRLIEINGQGCMTHKHSSPKGKYVKKLHFTLKGREDDTLLGLGFMRKVQPFGQKVQHLTSPT